MISKASLTPNLQGIISGSENLLEKKSPASSGDNVLDFLNLLNQNAQMDINPQTQYTQEILPESLATDTPKKLHILSPKMMNDVKESVKHNAQKDLGIQLQNSEIKDYLKSLDHVKAPNLGKSSVSDIKLSNSLNETNDNAKIKQITHAEAQKNITLSSNAQGQNATSLEMLKSRPLTDNKFGLKSYQKLQEPKLIKKDAQVLNQELEPVFDKVKNDALNFTQNSADMSSKLLAESSQGIGETQHKRSVETLAHQIAQKIEETQINRPLAANSHVKIEFQHEDLGHVTLNVKKSHRDLEIKILTGQLDAKNVIHENRDALIGQLAQKGISVSNFSVDSLSTTVSLLSDDRNSSQAGKFDSSSQQQHSQQSPDSSRHNNQSFTGKEKRDELWNILKEQREVTYA